MTMRSSIHLACVAATAGFLMAACSSTSLRVGGAPDTSVKNCVAAAARDHATRIAALAPQTARLHKKTFSALRAGAPSAHSLLATAYD